MESIKSNSSEIVDKLLQIAADREKLLQPGEDTTGLIDVYRQIGMKLETDDLETARAIARKIKELRR